PRASRVLGRRELAELAVKALLRGAEDRARELVPGCGDRGAQVEQPSVDGAVQARFCNAHQRHGHVLGGGRTPMLVRYASDGGSLTRETHDRGHEVLPERAEKPRGT